MEWFVVVGTARDLVLNPRSCSGGCLLLYRLSLDGTTMEFVHMVRQSCNVAILNFETNVTCKDI